MLRGVWLVQDLPGLTFIRDHIFKSYHFENIITTSLISLTAHSTDESLLKSERRLPKVRGPHLVHNRCKQGNAYLNFVSAYLLLNSVQTVLFDFECTSWKFQKSHFI